jgi:hypothetical protein
MSHPLPLLWLWNADAVYGVVLDRLNLVAFGSRFMGAATMELAEKVERAVWKMN